MVFHVFLISDFYLSNLDAKNCCLAADMLRLGIILNVLRLMLNISYSLEPGLVTFIFLYQLSLNLLDRSNPRVIHFDLLCLYLLNFTSLLVIVSIFSFFNYIMHYIIVCIRVCCQSFIYFVIHFG